jgi:hypothetical protein
MNETALKSCMIALLAVVVICLSVLTATGHDSGVKDGLLAITGAVGGLGVWERLKK